jgi:AraC-like DNA-binding protein
MSRSAFAVRFKELLGQTPLEYVTEWRMQKAIGLLQQRDKKLVEIAQSVGYDSDAAFSKAFKRLIVPDKCPCMRQISWREDGTSRSQRHTIVTNFEEELSLHDIEPFRRPRQRLL